MPVGVASNTPDEPWNEVQTIKELEKLSEHTYRIVQNTMATLGREVGVSMDGTIMLEHPLGGAISAIEDSLRACYSRYGFNMYADALDFEGRWSESLNLKDTK